MTRILLGLLLGVSATDAPQSSVRGFDQVAARSDRVDVTGIPMWMNGSFRVGQTGQGRVRRTALGAERIVDEGPGYKLIRQQRYGRYTFEVSGAEVSGTLKGDCRYGREESREDAGRASLAEPIEPLLLRCGFIRNGKVAGELHLSASGQPRVSGRTGFVRAHGAELRLRSVHQLAKSRWPVEKPLGYEMDGIDDQPVAAVDLNGGTRARLALPAEPDRRDAALAAGLALALFWDPGDTDD